MTKFSEMTAPQRNRWLAWANSHDWGGTSENHFSAANELVTFGAVCDASGVWSEERATHQTPSDLRAWAGY